MLISFTIDAHEGRDVATVDLPRAFMQADMDDVVHMKLVGTMAKLLMTRRIRAIFDLQQNG
jgi:hypothetical protein